MSDGYYLHATDEEVTEALAALGIHRRPGQSRDTANGRAPSGELRLDGVRIDTTRSDPIRHATHLAELQASRIQRERIPGDIDTRGMTNREVVTYLSRLGTGIPDVIAAAARNDPDGGADPSRGMSRSEFLDAVDDQLADDDGDQ